MEYVCSGFTYIAAMGREPRFFVSEVGKGQMVLIKMEEIVRQWQIEVGES